MNSSEQGLKDIFDEITKLRARAAELRRTMGSSEVSNYTLTGTSGEKVTLSDMFGSKDELIVIHNMGRSCRYCTLWADGINGFTKHFESRAAFALTSPDDYETMRRFGMERGWMFKMYSTEGTSFKRDLGFEDEQGEPQPGVSVFKKSADGKILQTTKDYFGPGDDYCPIWHFFDLLPSSSDSWEPQYHYIQTQHKH
ncbi:MAG TPA: DUF899 family protein [Candidatus Kapabacteria bacterium]|nr:DUF899 family protein [Candidatus Kapabacteria bacterium]